MFYQGYVQKVFFEKDEESADTSITLHLLKLLLKEFC